MSADPIVYCLEHLTDYRQFERLCSDVMSQSGYADIQPLGGSNDGGRDALHASRTNAADNTIFAYSVRVDWRRKLLSDCARIRDEKHALTKLVFACTASIAATEHDQAKQEVLQEFGWQLDLYDIERLRVRLVGELRHLIAQHPAIFCPPFFPRRAGLSIAESRDTLVIDHVAPDHALGTWLARRLQLAGYRTWCFGTAPLAGENADDSVRALIDRRALRYIPILSATSASDPNFVARCSLALNFENLILPCTAGAFDSTRLPTKMTGLAAIAFAEGWSRGLKQLLDALAAGAVVPSIGRDEGKAIALRSYVPEPVTRTTPETVYTNTFSVVVPEAIQVCELQRGLSDDEQTALRASWAFVLTSSTTLLAFDDPPKNVPLRPSQRREEYAWRSFDERHGERSTNIVKELVRRTMDVACVRAGLRWCDDRRVFYFPQERDVHWNVSFTHVDGRKTRVTMTGEKTQGSGERATPFRYQLCPQLRVGFDERGACWMTTRIYIRITDCKGVPLEGKAITRRRKTVAKNWWNNHWLARTLGMMQALSAGAEEILVGSGNRRVAMSCRPMEWSCPVSIDYNAVERLGDFQEEMAQLRYFDDEDADDAGGSVEIAKNEAASTDE